jgi:hypothetical protein
MAKKKDEERAAALRAHFQRIVEEAKLVSEEDVRAVLISNGKQITDYFLLGESLFAALVCHWQNGNLMTCLIEDTVLWIAVKLFLLRHNARVFTSNQALQQTALQENWPNAKLFFGGAIPPK